MYVDDLNEDAQRRLECAKLAVEFCGTFWNYGDRPTADELVKYSQKIYYFVNHRISKELDDGNS